MVLTHILGAFIYLLIKYLFNISLVAQTVKHLSTMWETWVRSLGWEDSLEKEMATHSSTLALKIPWRRSLVQATIHGVDESRAQLSNFTSLRKDKCAFQLQPARWWKAGNAYQLRTGASRYTCQNWLGQQELEWAGGSSECEVSRTRIQFIS